MSGKIYFIYFFIFLIQYLSRGIQFSRASLNGALTKHKNKDIKTLKLDNIETMPNEIFVCQLHLMIVIFRNSSTIDIKSLPRSCITTPNFTLKSQRNLFADKNLIRIQLHRIGENHKEQN